MERVALAFLACLFRVQDFIRSLFRIRSKVPTEPPMLPGLHAVRNGGWGYLPSRHGDLLFYRYWLPADGVPPRAYVVALHGLGAYGGHYWVLGEYLAKLGFRTYAPDLRGHGYSEGPRGAMDNADLTTDGIMDLVHFVTAGRHDIPLFVLGESFGAFLVMMAAARDDPVISGLVMAGTPVEPTEAASAESLRDTLGEYLRYLPYLFIDSTARVIDITGREERVSRDPAEVERTKHDPLRNNRQSPRTFAEVFRVTIEWPQYARQVKVPTLLLQGGHDLVTNPSGVYRIRDALGAADIETVVYPDAYHGLFFDPDTPKVLETIAQWLEKQVAGIRYQQRGKPLEADT